MPHSKNKNIAILRSYTPADKQQVLELYEKVWERRALKISLSSGIGSTTPTLFSQMMSLHPSR